MTAFPYLGHPFCVRVGWTLLLNLLVLSSHSNSKAEFDKRRLRKDDRFGAGLLELG